MIEEVEQRYQTLPVCVVNLKFKNAALNYQRRLYKRVEWAVLERRVDVTEEAVVGIQEFKISFLVKMDLRSLQKLESFWTIRCWKCAHIERKGINVGLEFLVAKLQRLEDPKHKLHTNRMGLEELRKARIIHKILVRRAIDNIVFSYKQLKRYKTYRRPLLYILRSPQSSIARRQNFHFDQRSVNTFAFQIFNQGIHLQHHFRIGAFNGLQLLYLSQHFYYYSVLRFYRFAN